MRIRKEEYTALADFILPSFRRDQTAIAARYPRLDADFLIEFERKLDYVRGLESSLILTERRKTTTAALYELADILNSELNFLAVYIKDAGLNRETVSALKNDLRSRNIEGSILKIEALKQYVAEHQGTLTLQGMPANTVTALEDFRQRLTTKNEVQNQYMNALKQLTETNTAHYEELYQFIATIAEKGKLVFKDSVILDEYTLEKNLSRMRAGNQRSAEERTVS